MQVVQTFATEEPEMVPMSPELTTATLAGPPVDQPARARERSMTNLPIPVFSRTDPKRMNMNTKVEETPRGTPKTPSVPRYMWLMIRETENPRWASMSGMDWPK